MWGFTGFCFAQRYVHAPLWGCVFHQLFYSYSNSDRKTDNIGSED